jgi:RNA polymerase sigma-54 factor
MSYTMKQSIQLRLGQHLTMTPQLQQAIRLLQLSTLELQLEVQRALEANPMLEAAEDEDGFDAMENGEHVAQSGPSQDNRLEVREPEPDIEVSPTAIPEELPVDSAWEDIYDTPATPSQAGEPNGRELEIQGRTGESLQEHLLWQMRLAHFSDTDMAIAVAIIDAVNDDGYLTATVEDIHQGLVDELDIDPSEVEAVLHRIQSFDPVGVGARNLQECLLIQLCQLDPATPWLAPSKKLVRDHLDLLAAHDYNQLTRQLKVSEQELRQMIALIQSLNPRPGGQITSADTQYIVPDVFVRKHKGAWRVELNPETAPRVRINPYYAGLVRRADSSADNTYMKNHLQEARWFLKSLQSRSETLLKVASCIVEQQRGFLEHGDEAMKPLVLRDIAEAVSMHESTISRVTTQKYMHTPRGIYEFKYFFSSHVSTADGGECSATAIRAMLKKLVANEDPARPLSDNKLAELLLKQGINVARRTVAKYREAMAIPPSNERKRLA